MIKRHLLWSAVLTCWLILSAAGGEVPLGSPPCAGLTNATILIIRHAEKPSTGVELNPTGVLRAKAYVGYFKAFQIEGQPLTLAHIFCTADSKGSHRPRLTVTPLGEALQLPLDSRYKNKDAPLLAQEIRAQPHGQHLLICWHHGEIPTLLTALGEDPQRVLPHGEWPDEVFGWLIELHYDGAGRLQEAKCLNEHLMPDNQAVPKLP